jgi:protein-L-isoaspartate(D-aspartate) O-methyltransferase
MFRSRFHPSSDPFVDARRRMVDTQLARRGIQDPHVLAAMRTVPRHRFVEPAYHSEAYSDHPVPIGFGQTISQPYIVAYMVEQLRLSPGARVLEIGTGSGYQTAVLAQVAAFVYSIEIVRALADRARQTLAEIGVTNVEIRHGDGHGGWPDQAPFDGIIVSAAPGDVPTPLVEQLAEGAHLIVPVGHELQELIVVARTTHGSETEHLIPVRFVPFTRDSR